MGVFVDILRQLLTDEHGVPLPEEDRVGLTLMSEGMTREVWVAFCPPSELTVDEVMRALSTVLQSNQTFLFNSEMHVKLTHVPLPAGGGRMGIKSHAMSERLQRFLKQKRCIVEVGACERNTCCATAIVLGRLYMSDRRRFTRCRESPRQLLDLVYELQEQADVPLGTMCGPAEWDAFQRVLGNEYSLVVVSSGYFNTVIYQGNPRVRKLLVLYHAEKHFHFITSLQAFMRANYLCSKCLGTYKHNAEHRYVKTIIFGPFYHLKKINK